MVPRLAHLAQEDSRLPATHDTLGSLTRVVHELTQRLAETHHLTRYSVLRPGDLGEEVSDGVRDVRLPAGVDRRLFDSYYRWRNRVGRRLRVPERAFPASAAYYFSYIRRIARRLAAERTDLVHLHNVSQFVPPLRRALPHARIVLHMHCEWLVDLPRGEVAERLAGADLVLGVSTHIVRQIAAAFPAFTDRCRVLHNGIELEAFPPRDRVEIERRDSLAALRARFGLRGPVVLFVGRLSSEKGVHSLLEAFARVRARRPDASCVVVGPDWGPGRKVRVEDDRPVGRQIRLLDRDYMGRLRDLAAPHGDRVVFAGAVPNHELSLYHALADVLVAPSLLEAFGIPVAEAGASALPVVATATGGLPDIIVPDETGLLVPPGNATALADAIERVLADPGWARALGRAARTRVAVRFTWDRIAETLAGYYEELLATRTAGRAA